MSSCLRRVTAAFVAVATACGYTSEYVPPDDWRVRPIYQGNEIVTVGPTGPPVCADEVAPQLATVAPPPIMVIDEQGYWAPSTSVQLVIAGPHVLFYPAPPPPHPPGGHGGVVVAGSSASSGDGSEALAAVLLALAVLAASGVAIGLAASPAEKQKPVSAGIDEVNQRNDQARHKMNECIRRLSPPPALVPPQPPAPGPEPAPAPAPAPGPEPAPEPGPAPEPAPASGSGPVS